MQILAFLVQWFLRIKKKNFPTYFYTELWTLPWALVVVRGSRILQFKMFTTYTSILAFLVQLFLWRRILNIIPWYFCVRIWSPPWALVLVRGHGELHFIYKILCKYWQFWCCGSWKEYLWDTPYTHCFKMIWSLLKWV